MISRDVTGLDVHSPTADRWRLLRDQGVELTVLVMSRQMTTWQESGIRVEGSGGTTIIHRIKNTARRAKQLGSSADLITAQDPFELGWIAWRVARRFKKPFELQDHGGFFDGQIPDEPLWWLRSRLARFLSRRANQIRTVSPQNLVSGYFLPIAAHPRFAEIERRPESGCIVCVARLIAVKRVDLLIRTFVEVRKSDSLARLVLVGDGPERASLEALAHALGVSAWVTFVGASDPAPWLAKASVFVLLSKHEGWGVAAVEAGLAGVPVVMSDTGCARWLEKRGSATVVQGSDPVQIAQTIRFAMQQPGRKLQDVLSQQETAIRQVDHWKQCPSTPSSSLLVVIQAVDLDDPLMGFFHGWLEVASTQFSHLTVLALRVGRHALPSNVHIIALRPAGSRSRFQVIRTLLLESWRKRDQYQAVFVRGDAYYVILASWLWRLLSKRIVFWYAHYTVSVWALIASAFAHVTTASVKASYNHPWVHPVFIGQNIDHHRFVLRERCRSSQDPWRCLVFGRVMPSKRIEEVIETFVETEALHGALLTIVGPQPDPIYKAALMKLTQDHPSIQWGSESVSYDHVPELLSQYDILLNAYQGSLDKAIVESTMSGMIPIAATDGMQEWLPQTYRWLMAKTIVERRMALERVMHLSEEEYVDLQKSLREAAVNAHSMEQQIERLKHLL